MFSELRDRSTLFFWWRAWMFVWWVMRQAEQCHNPFPLSCDKGAQHIPSSRSRGWVRNFPLAFIHLIYCPSAPILAFFMTYYMKGLKPGEVDRYLKNQLIGKNSCLHVLLQLFLTVQKSKYFSYWHHWWSCTRYYLLFESSSNSSFGVTRRLIQSHSLCKNYP